MAVDEEAPQQKTETTLEVTEELPILTVRDTVLFPCHDAHYGGPP